MRADASGWKEQQQQTHVSGVSIENMASRSKLSKLTKKELWNLLPGASRELTKADLVEQIISKNAIRESEAPAIGQELCAQSALLPKLPGLDIPPFDKVPYTQLSSQQVPEITFSDVFQYLITRKHSIDGHANNFKGLDRATKHLDAGDVGPLQMFKVNDSITYIKSSCLASMKKVRYTLYICLRNAVPEYAYCLCPVGMAQTCSHIGAVLLQVNMMHRQQAQNNTQSCTSKLCSWNVPRRSMSVEPKPVSHFNLAKPQLDCDNKPVKRTMDFDPRHSSVRDFDGNYSVNKLMELKKIYPRTELIA